MMYERLIPCNVDYNIRANDPNLNISFHCIKVVGYDKETGSNVTARGCLSSPDGFVPNSDHVDSGDITFGRDLKIRGTAYFCNTDACNEGKKLNAKSVSMIVISFVLIFTAATLFS